MSDVEKSKLVEEAQAALVDASNRVAMAILFRDFALAGDVEKALTLKQRMARS